MGHYCKEHETVFFKKGKMRGYAHPIQDDKGKDTGEWCNEPEEGGDEMPQEVKPTQQITDKDKQINRAVALKAAVRIASAKIMMGGEMTTAKILVTAELFESYLDNGVVVKEG